MLYLYKAVDALIASNRANPVHDGAVEPSTSIAINLDVEKTSAPLSVTPERHLSPSITHDVHSHTNGTLVKSNSGHGFESATTDTTTTTDDDNVTTALLRRHSLPGNGCAVVIANGNSHKPEMDADEEEDDDENSETAVLTTSCQKETAVSESQL